MANLTKMNRKQLEKVIKDAQKALKTLENKERREAKKAAEAAAAKFGFSLADLTNGVASSPKKKAKTAPKKVREPKYANPADAAQTWSGMGRQPAWYKDAVAAGVDPKTLEI
ncbi:H-NS histone family protein [uncultured Roseobacter sp.]|uniref:H-NS histone family protein n=1 Tax=uncultured Roseobacter sp. TaxID=114847 RepID=UPI002620C77D|nr:H-NS histone family protein [uncultured Roseobacter sp.]